MTTKISAQEAVTAKMRKAGCTPAQIRRFQRNRHRYLEEGAGQLPESELDPVDSLPRLEALPLGDEVLLRQVVVIKLNGGLGTSMGLEGPKALLPVRGNHSFLELVVGQLCHLRKTQGLEVPLLLMNSFNTQQSTNQALAEMGFEQDHPHEFLQSRIPKLTPDGEPARDDGQPHYEWCPPGHGDLYPSLRESGLVESLRERGIRWAFVSNVDNLGAVLDLRILRWLAQEQPPFLMEVTRRTESDRKGGHLARHAQTGQLLLREVAQCPESDAEAFGDIERHRYFNTNNLWLDLEALDERWDDLPLIVNRKPLRPDQPDSPPVVQLETAMGAAIGTIEGARAIEVPRTRFVPVKTTSDLLVVRSDLFDLREDFSLVRTDQGPLPAVDLDSNHYKLMADFESLVSGVPSLKACQGLRVEGPVRLHDQTVLEGEVHLVNSSDQPRQAPAGRLEGRHRL
ncbi:MAG: UTP--glucose-1-phosphate uridylyltransferase [Vulcanimicrobiota bacterium]